MAKKSKAYSGYNEKTAENLILDAGALFINFDIESDDYDTAKTAGKLLGATRGGGEFKATPTMRRIEVDGVKGAAKGLQVIDEWEVTLSANVLELTTENLAKALTSSELDTETNATYNVLRAKNYIELEDYIDNVTWVGRLSGSEKPVIIQVYNAINTNGLTITTKDKDEAVTQMIFTGHYGADDLDNPPFSIFYPKPAAPKPEPAPAK